MALLSYEQQRERVLNSPLVRDFESCGTPVVVVHGVHEKEGVYSCTCERGVECSSKGKHPCGGSWQRRSFVALKQAQEKYVGSNIGILTGRFNKNLGKFLVVLDVDDLTSPMVSELDLLKTLKQRSGSGGFHYFFWNEKPLPSGTKVFPGTDVRGVGGMLVLSPSQHVSGGIYDFFPFSEETFELAVKDLPSSYEKVILNRGSRKPSSREKTLPKKIRPTEDKYLASLRIKELNKELEDGKKIPVGARNDILFRAACAERYRLNGSATVETQVKFLLEFQEKYAEKPLTLEEIEKIAKSSLKYENKTPIKDRDYVQRFINFWKRRTRFSYSATYIKSVEEMFWSKVKRVGDTRPQNYERDKRGHKIKYKDWCWTPLHKIEEARRNFYKGCGIDLYPEALPCQIVVQMKERKNIDFKTVTTAKKKIFPASVTFVERFDYEEFKKREGGPGSILLTEEQKARVELFAQRQDDRLAGRKPVEEKKVGTAISGSAEIAVRISSKRPLLPSGRRFNLARDLTRGFRQDRGLSAPNEALKEAEFKDYPKPVPKVLKVSSQPTGESVCGNTS